VLFIDDTINKTQEVYALVPTRPGGGPPSQWVPNASCVAFVAEKAACSLLTNHVTREGARSCGLLFGSDGDEDDGGGIGGIGGIGDSGGGSVGGYGGGGGCLCDAETAIYRDSNRDNRDDNMAMVGKADAGGNAVNGGGRGGGKGGGDKGARLDDRSMLVGAASSSVVLSGDTSDPQQLPGIVHVQLRAIRVHSTAAGETVGVTGGSRGLDVSGGGSPVDTVVRTIDRVLKTSNPEVPLEVLRRIRTVLVQAGSYECQSM
jgi:hypothetical protein